MSLQDIDIKNEYRSLIDNVAKDFYIPLLKEAVSYKRAVGFFSSSALVEISKGIAGLIQNGGKIQLIASPYLSDDDVEAMRKGYELRENIIENALLRELKDVTGSFEKERLNLLANLIADGVLDIKIALTEKNGELGMYHEKMGIISDLHGNKVAFSGSMNESATAMMINYEAIDVFCSWNGDTERVSSKENAFESIWNNVEPNIKTIYFPKINYTIIKKYKSNDSNYNIDKEELYTSIVCEERPMYIGANIPDYIKLHDYQVAAIDKWEEFNYHGIFDMATGIGKTYLAAFDSKNYKRVLFVAHREEILRQAADSFYNIRQSKDYGFFTGNQKTINASVIFALVQSLGKEDFLNSDFFAKDYFDYIIIDEFHHAVAGNYRNIINYFSPKFLLGLTATPERMDAKDVFELCDYNIVYEVRLKEAINKGWLAPFHYYGIYDETVNYDNLQFINGKYNDKDLEEALMLDRRSELIYKHYSKYKSNRALGFCSSKKHSEYMASKFCMYGVNAVAVYSGAGGKYSKNRREAVEGMIKGHIEVIFSVDMFNEGLDIRDIDLVMFLRPTQSPTVFLQQLGRGLRKSKNKKYLNVLDFIGNYKKANFIPIFLSNGSHIDKKNNRYDSMDFEYPDECIVDFDLQVIDIFKKQAEQELSIKDKIKNEFDRIKAEIGKVPSRMEMFTQMDSSLYDSVRTKSRLNIFRDYLVFLEKMDSLSEDEKYLCSGRGKDFINMIETTSMSKTYKMPVLLAFYNYGNVKTEINEDDIYKSFYEFYSKGSNKVDMLRDKSTKSFENWGKDRYIKLAKDNPIRYMLKTHGDFFIKKEGILLALTDDLEDISKFNIFSKHMKDAIDYRVMSYYRNRGLDLFSASF